MMEMPQITKNTIHNYVQHRIPPGGFMTAVLQNNLFEAVGKADIHNQAALQNIVIYIYNEIPSNCWGSPKIVEDWLSKTEEKGHE